MTGKFLNLYDYGLLASPRRHPAHNIGFILAIQQRLIVVVQDLEK